MWSRTTISNLGNETRNITRVHLKLRKQNEIDCNQIGFVSAASQRGYLMLVVDFSAVQRNVVQCVNKPQSLMRKGPACVNMNQSRHLVQYLLCSSS